MVDHWNCLPREAVIAPNLTEFKDRHLDWALSHISFRFSARCRELDLLILMGPFQPGIFYGSVTNPGAENGRVWRTLYQTASFPPGNHGPLFPA